MSSPTGIVVLNADSTVSYVDHIAPEILETDRASLLDGTAEVLQDPVFTADDVSHPSLQAFLDEFLGGEGSIETIRLSRTHRAEVRRSARPDGRSGAILTVQRQNGETEERDQTSDPNIREDANAAGSQDLQLFAEAVGYADAPLVIAAAPATSDEDPTIRYANPRFSELTGYSSDEVDGQSLLFLAGTDTDPDAVRRLRSALAARRMVRETIVCYTKDGHPYWNDMFVAPLPSASDDTDYFVSVQQDVTRRNRAIRLLDAQSEILDEIPSGSPLSDILGRVVAAIEENEPDLHASVVLVNQETDSLEHAAAKGLSRGLIDAVDGLHVGSDSTTIGATVYRGEAVITEDIGRDERWKQHRDAALEHDLRACWSVPIQGGDNDVLGTVTVYRHEPGAPNQSEQALLENAARLSAVAIEHDRQKRARHLQEEQLQRLVENAQPIVFLLDEKGTILISEGEDLSRFGIEPGQHVGKSIYDLYEDEPELLEYIDRALAGETIDSILELGDLVLDIWYSPYYDTDGEVAGCIGMAVDITERQQAEEALRFNRELLRRTQELARVGGWEYDPQADSMIGTEETYRIYEIPVDAEITLDESLSFYPSTLESALREAAIRCLQEGEPFDLEGPMTAAEGAERWVRIRGEPRRNDEGTIVKMVGTVQDVTERHQMEAELRERKRWVQSINENVAGGIYRSTDQGLVYANQAFLDLFGYDSLEEMTATDPQNFYQNPDVRSELIRRGNEQGGLDGVEVEYRRKDDSTFTGLVRSRRVEAEEEEQTYYDGVVTNISEQKNRERKFRRQREKIEAVYESSGRLLEAKSHDEVASIITSVLTETFGYARVIVRCVDDGDLVPITYQPSSIDVSSIPVSGVSIVARIYRSGETRIFGKDSTHGAESSGIGNNTGAGIPLGDYGILTLTNTDANGIDDFDLRLLDILAQKGTAVLGRIEHEKQLRDSEERFRGLFEEAAVGIALIDPNGQIVEANSALASMFDTSRVELQARSFSKLAHANQRETLRNAVEEIIEGERERYEIEQRYERDDGSIFWGRLTVSRHNGPGEAEAICMVEDVSSRKQYEHELKEAKEEAEEASRLKSALLANMSHEIRTPLTSIIGFAGVLEDNLSGPNAEYARLAHAGGKRLMDTLESVLQLSKLEAGVIEPSAQQMDLVGIARRTLALSRPEAEAADVSLEFETTMETLEGRWTPTAVQRVLSNLIRNAIKFTPEGGRVTVRVQSSGSRAVLEVEDTGVGISDEFRPLLFDAFTQESEGLKREHEGSGLGLAIVKRLVDLLQGQIEVESTKGEGTCFTVALPFGD